MPKKRRKGRDRRSFDEHEKEFLPDDCKRREEENMTPAEEGAKAVEETIEKIRRLLRGR